MIDGYEKDAKRGCNYDEVNENFAYKHFRFKKQGNCCNGRDDEDKESNNSENVSELKHLISPCVLGERFSLPSMLLCY